MINRQMGVYKLFISKINSTHYKRVHGTINQGIPRSSPYVKSDCAHE